MPNDVERLRQALLNRDPRAMQLSIVSFMTTEAGEKEAKRLLNEEMPEDVRSWWLDDVCYLPHGLEPEAGEVLLLVRDLIKEGRLGQSTSTREA